MVEWTWGLYAHATQLGLIRNVYCVLRLGLTRPLRGVPAVCRCRCSWTRTRRSPCATLVGGAGL